MNLPGISTQTIQEKKEEVPMRFGTPVEKNVILTEDKIKSVYDSLTKKIEIYSAYPDIWADEVLIPTSSSFTWMFYQRIILRLLARIPLNHITGARGVSKTFLILFAFFHRAIFAPGSQLAFAAPSKTQSAQIGKQTVNDLLSRFPGLANELDGPVIGGKDYFEVRFKNGSKIEITAALETTRGRRFDGIAVDEARRMVCAL